MKIELEKIGSDAVWMVLLGSCRVRFSSRNEAQAFIEQLQARLNAPHHWPRDLGLMPLEPADAVRSASPNNVLDLHG